VCETALSAPKVEPREHRSKTSKKEKKKN
jgi:hypothetical protein